MSDFNLLGFTQYASKILDILVRGDLYTVKELYEKTRIPKNKIYETLDHLISEGMVAQEDGKPKKYFLINDAIFDEILEKRKDELEQLKDRLTDLRNKKEKINPSVLSIVDGADEMHRLIEYSNLSIKNEILSCSRLRKMYYGCFRTLKTAIDRGVVVKFIAPQNSDAKVLRSYHDIGVEIRVWKRKGVFPKIGLLDGKYTRITIAQPDVKDDRHHKTIWANSTILYNIVRNHFDKLWDESDPFVS